MDYFRIYRNTNDFNSAVDRVKEIYAEKSKSSENAINFCLVPHKYLRIIIDNLPSSNQLDESKKKEEYFSRELTSKISKLNDDYDRVRVEIKDIVDQLNVLNRKDVAEKLSTVLSILDIKQE